MKKIKLAVIRVLTFFKLLDDNFNLSLTNTLLYIYTYKMMLTPMAETSFQDLSMGLSVIGLYLGKKIVNGAKAIKKTEVENAGGLNKIKKVTNKMLV